MKQKEIIILKEYKYITLFPTMRYNLNRSFCLTSRKPAFVRRLAGFRVREARRPITRRNF